MTARLVVMASGNGSNLQAVLDACAAGDLPARVVAVVSDRPGATALDRAQRAGVPALLREAPRIAPGQDPMPVRRRYDVTLASDIAEVGPDWIVLAGWMRLLSSAFLDRFPGRVLNLHPALPGAFPGTRAIDEAWQAHVDTGLDHTGVMVHLVPDEGIDDGPVLAQRRVPIESDDTRDVLEQRIHRVEHDLLVDTIADLVSAG